MCEPGRRREAVLSPEGCRCDNRDQQERPPKDHSRWFVWHPPGSVVPSICSADPRGTGRHDPHTHRPALPGAERGPEDQSAGRSFLSNYGCGE
uniref:Uncharacterized protein n=1 Tax=Molossus molossus TaxID=27622 RepID=A0A7J8C8E1_MOLMO|nr:hypothetical protein HJG59_009860 [Molossus molossus]